MTETIKTKDTVIYNLEKVPTIVLPGHTTLRKSPPRPWERGSNN